MNQENRTIRKKNKRKNHFFTALLVGMIAILFIAFLSVQNGSLKTATVMVETVEDKVTAEGVLAFEEELFTSDSDGEALFVYPDGQRIVSKVKIATVYQGSIDEKTKEKLLIANNNIKQSETRLNNKVNMPSDPAMAKKEISSIANSVAVETDALDYSNVYQYKNDIISRVDYIHSKSGNESLEAKNIQQLKAQIAEIENSIQYAKKQYYNTQTGIFSTKIDGFENLIHHQNVKNISAKDLASVLKADPEISSGVTAGVPFCKVINNYRWYISGLFPSEKIEQLKSGSSVKIRIPGLSAVAVKGTVVSISEPENNRCAVVISSTEHIEGLFESRLMQFELIKQECSGFRIPTQAITELDGEEGVFVIRSGVAKFRPVHKVYEEKNFVLSETDAESELGNASGLVLYDLVILEPEKVYEDKIIKDYAT